MNIFSVLYTGGGNFHVLRSCHRMRRSVFLFVPNLIGYVRIVLIVIGWFFYDRISVFLPLYAVSTFLDGIDGCAARAFGQTSAFGAWLDVLVDNIGRSILWSRLYDTGILLSGFQNDSQTLRNCSKCINRFTQWGIFVVCLEWTVFVCTHTLGSQWKQAFGAAPWWVKATMENGFYTPTGVFVVAGVHVLPVYLYFYQHKPDWPSLEHVEFLLVVPVIILSLARLLCLAVELWCIKTHILHLILIEEERALHSLTKDFDDSKSDSPS